MYSDLLNDIEKDVNGNWEDIVVKKYIEDRNKFHDDVHNVLDMLIELNLRNRENKKYLKDVISLNNYVVEYCTVRFDIGRSVGKTEWIKRRITDNDIIIVMNENQKRTLIHEGVNKKNIITSYQAKRDYFNDKKYVNIYVDEAFFFNDRDLNYLYGVFGNRKVEQTFILLG